MKVCCSLSFKYYKCIDCHHSTPHEETEDPSGHACTKWSLCYIDMANDEYEKVRCLAVKEKKNESRKATQTKE